MLRRCVGFLFWTSILLLLLLVCVVFVLGVLFVFAAVVSFPFFGPPFPVCCVRMHKGESNKVQGLSLCLHAQCEFFVCIM